MKCDNNLLLLSLLLVEILYFLAKFLRFLRSAGERDTFRCLLVVEYICF